MKSKRLLSKIISFVLCILVLLSSVVTAHGNTGADSKSDNEPNVSFIFAFLKDKPEILGGEIISLLVYGTEVKVLGYSGAYVYVEDVRTEKRGYIFYWFVDDKSEFNREYDHVYVGQTNSGRLKHKNGANIEWTAKPSGYVSIDPVTKVITGIKPGTVTITAKAGFRTRSCTVVCINPWKEQETSIAENNIDVFPHYNSNAQKIATISRGSSITAKGDLADGSGWIYVNSGSTWGFIKLTDFSGIDYLMTQYHYYDEGYKERFGSPSTKIYDYASVLNDVMMANFGLKVCPYVGEYTSIADDCKILSYKEVDKNNISKDCPKSRGHKNDSCLKSIHIRDDLIKLFGNGGGTVSKVAWTGHIMSDYENDRSNATIGMGSIIINPYGTINSTPSKLRKDRLYTLVHETGHQFILNDHYCNNDKTTNGGTCSNPYCSDCNGEPLPVGCIMFERVDVEDTSLTKIYCINCQNNILNYINNF